MKVTNLQIVNCLNAISDLEQEEKLKTSAHLSIKDLWKIHNLKKELKEKHENLTSFLKTEIEASFPTFREFEEKRQALFRKTDDLEVYKKRDDLVNEYKDVLSGVREIENEALSQEVDFQSSGLNLNTMGNLEGIELKHIEALAPFLYEE